MKWFKKKNKDEAIVPDKFVPEVAKKNMIESKKNVPGTKKVINGRVAIILSNNKAMYEDTGETFTL